MTPEVSEALAALRQEFIGQLGDRLAGIRARHDELVPATWDAAALEALHRAVHGLTGAAGTFGLSSVSSAAREVEQALAAILHAGQPPDAALWQQVGQRLDRLEQQARLELDRGAQVLMQPPGVLSLDRSPLVYVVEDDAQQGEFLRQTLVDQGYRVRHFPTPQALRDTLRDTTLERPRAVVMDLVFADGDDAGIRLMAELGLGKGSDVPVVVLTVLDDMASRLQAFRAGASRYLSKPVEPGRLLDVLDALTGRQPAQPFRVLLVDDDELLLEAQAAVLRQVGMVVRVLADPLQLLEVVADFEPDVVLLDVYMPEASGPELAAVLRERDAYLHLPILFLSAETDMRQQLLALNLGGDDFLVKPVQPDHLVAAVTARARRSRQSMAIRQRLQTTLYEREREHLALDHHAIVSIADATGKIVYVNDKFCEISGYQRHELVGQNHRVVKSAEHPPEFYREMWRVISGGEVWQGEVCNRRKDGSLYWVESTITPFLDDNGLPYQYVSMRTDITHTKLAQAALRDSEVNLRATLEATKDGILAVDGQGCVVFVNDQFRQMWRVPDDMDVTEGQHDAMLLEHAQRQLKDPQAFLSKVRALYGSDAASYDLLEFQDGRVFERHSQPLMNRGRTDGRVWSFHDVTERVHAQAEALAHKERLRRGQMYANIGTWEWNIQTGELSWTERIAPLFGYPLGDLETSYDNFISAVHPDDRQAVTDAVAACVERDVPYDIEHRVVWPDGTVRWLLERGAVQRDAEGTALRMIGVVQDIDDRKRAELALIATRDEADRANRAKSEFLSSMSHELRTPLNAILGFGQLMEYDDDLPAEHQDNVHEILKAGRHLLDLINEVLDLAKVESGRIDLSMESVELRSVVQECRGLVQPLADPRGIRIHCGDIDGYRMRTDRTRLKQVLLNLLSNAIKYNRDGGSVHLDAELRPQGLLRLLVRDTGRGMSSEKLGELFQPFNRLGADKTGIEGTGIGLTITRRIVEIMGGQVGVESQEGVGSTFWIDLPSEDVLTVPSSGPLEQPAPGMPTTERLSSQREHALLYIEDNPANLKLVTQMLSRRQHIHLRTAHLPGLGIELAMAQRPDLILLDINMPDMDGYQVLEVFKSDPRLRDVPVVAVTANAMPRDIERGLAAGFADYLTKPLALHRFLAVLDKYLHPDRVDGSGTQAQQGSAP